MKRYNFTLDEDTIKSLEDFSLATLGEINLSMAIRMLAKGLDKTKEDQ